MGDDQRRLSELQANVSSQITDVRQAVSGGLSDVRVQIGSLPDQRARLDQAERRLAESDAPLKVLIETTTLDISAGQPATDHVRPQERATVADVMLAYRLILKREADPQLWAATQVEVGDTQAELGI